MAGAPLGNHNAANGKRWLNAIDSALANRCKSDGQKALVELASKMLDAAELGEPWAINHLADRLDGKPAQSLTVGSDPDQPFLVQPVRPKITEAEWKELKLVKQS